MDIEESQSHNFINNKKSSEVYFCKRQFHSKHCQQYYRRSKPNAWGCHSQFDLGERKPAKLFFRCTFKNKII